MGKRERLEDSVKLKTTGPEFQNLKERAKRSSGKYSRNENPIVAVDKNILAKLIEDYEVLMKLLKKTGTSIRRELHYNETEEWKQLNKGKLEVPSFLGKGVKKQRVRL